MPRAPMSRTWRQAPNIRSGAPVLFFSLEMAAQQLSARILSEQTEIEMWKIRNGRFSESEWEKFVLTMQDLSTLPLYHRRYRRHFHRPDRRPRPPPEARKEYRPHHHRLSAAGRTVAPRRKPGAGNHRGHQGPQGPGQGTERAGAGAVAAVARRRCARRQAPGAVGLARIRLDRAGRRRGDVRLSRGILSEVARARAGLAPNTPNGWKSASAATNRAEVLVEKHRHGATRGDRTVLRGQCSPASATWRRTSTSRRADQSCGLHRHQERAAPHRPELAGSSLKS